MPLLAGPFQSQWDAAIAYVAGNVVFDRGGWWLAVSANTNSRPISGNTDWSLVAGIPYVDVVLDPVALTTAPFFDEFLAGPGVTIVPAPGSGLVLIPMLVATSMSDGDAWNTEPGSDMFYGDPGDGLIVVAMNIGEAAFDAAPLLGNGEAFIPLVKTNTITAGGSFTNKRLTLAGQGVLADGTRSWFVRTYYQIAPVAGAAPPSTFYSITGVSTVAKTFTVSDVGADLSGATGTFEVVGNTGGNNGTYTIVSAVSGAGSTVITTVEAIPFATADGWVKQT